MHRRFFIILRGCVSVMIKEQADDQDLGDETLDARHFDREQLGNAVVQLRESNPSPEGQLSQARACRNVRLW